MQGAHYPAKYALSDNNAPRASIRVNAAARGVEEAAVTL